MTPPRSSFKGGKPSKPFAGKRHDAGRDGGYKSHSPKSPSANKLNAPQGDMLYGLHAVKAALDNPARTVKTIWFTEAAKRDLDGWDLSRHPSPLFVEKTDLERLLPKGAVHQGVAIVVEPFPEMFLTDLIIAAETRPRTVLVMLDEVTDPHNIGAILRSMSAFGAHALITHRYNSPGITGTLAKTATGAVEHVPIVPVTNLARSLQELQEAGFLTVGCDERATHAIHSLPAADKIVLVLGAEGKGLRPSTRAQCAVIATIPTTGAIASLNVSNAAAIALFCLQKESVNH